nr:PREDICTED: cullin-9 [Opisthocomus hoazin]
MAGEPPPTLLPVTCPSPASWAGGPKAASCHALHRQHLFASRSWQERSNRSTPPQGAGTFPVMVDERRDGSLLVHLGPNLQAHPEEVLRQRRGQHGHPEDLPGIGSLAGAFKETGALDLLMEMLCHKEQQIRHSAGKMLRALASHDAGSRAYVLLSLSQQDGIEQHMDFDSRHTLLELFAETISSEEQCCVSFEGIHLPQIPGKLLFVLVKRYLCVTSLMDTLSSGAEEGGERQGCPGASLVAEERSRVKQEFEFSMAMANLLLELVHVMGWDHSHEAELVPQQDLRPRTTHSIFQPKTPACTAAQMPVLTSNRGRRKKQGGAFLTRSDFSDRSGYVEYLQANLVRGTRVRLLEDSGDVRAGEEGEFLQSTNSMHTAQVLWQSTGRTYWMCWHMLEIIGFGDQWEEPAAQEKEYSPIESFKLDTVAQPFFWKLFGGLYSLPYLGEQPAEAAEALSRAEWWELLFFVKKLEAEEQKEIACLIQQDQGEQLSEVDEEALIQLSVPAELARKVLRVLEERCQGSTRRDLHGSHVYAKYFLERGTEQGGGGSTGVSPEGASCRSAGPEGPTAKEDLSAAPAAAAKSDSELFSELLASEGLFFPEVTEEQAKVLGSSEGLSERGSLARIGAVVDVIQSSSSEVGLRLAGLKHIVKILEEEPEAEHQALKVLVGAVADEPGGAGEKPLPLSHADAQMMREIFASIGSASSEGSASLLSAIPAAMSTMQSVPGIELVLGQIEEHRRSQQPISIPFFDVFLRNLCRGSSVKMKEDKCWEKVQVSSNPHRASKLTDRNPKTYWESNGSSGSHFITVHMQRGVVVRWAGAGRASGVRGGGGWLSVCLQVTVLPSDSRVILLENMTRFWPIIQIRVKRCQQGGIDTRVRGIEVLGPKPTFWPIFKEQLCQRTFLSCTARARAWCQEICQDRGRLLQLFAPGVLRLNQAALACASGRHLRLLPRQSYLRAERAEVSALERKRNVLCCLITRILKVEKQLHIDNLVFRVQDTLSIPDDVARHLLMHCRWNVDFLIQCYVENHETLLISSGLQVQDAQPPPSPGTHCPVCVNQLCPTEKPPTLCCMHYCCKLCWREYLTTRIEQNMVVNCTCPISECRAQPTTAFIRSIVSSEEIIAKYEKALLRGYVECCSNLTWCTNPQGCDQILLKDGLGYGVACSKCSWISCFNCNFPEAHYPASCSHMSQWVDDDGYYEGMTSEAQSKHLAKLISKHCPSCQAQIEKNEGCLHMTCAKCNHGFCWRCLKPWRPTHKDYYNCSAMVSKAAWQKKRFQDYNERCTFHHRAREFAVSLRNRVSSIREMPKIRTLTFVLDACKVLEQARKVLAYSCVYSYYNQDTESMDIVEQQTESLELHTNALQILLEETLLQYQDLASSLQLLKAEHFSAGLELVHQIKERLFAILWHSMQDFHVGLQTLADPGQRKVKLSNVPTSAPACIGPKRTILCDSPNTDEGGKEVEDEEYEPQWQEDYDDDDDLDEDNFLFDDDSDNLDCDSYFDEDDAYD